MKKLLLLLAAFCCSLSSIAADFEMDGIRYYITSSTEPYTVKVTHNTEYSGDVVIPASVTYQDITYAVTSIGEKAFYRRRSLTSITIPNSVTSIGQQAFWGCTGLTSITIPNSVTSIGQQAFWGCTGLTSITVESGNSVYHSTGNCLIETATKTLIVGCQTSVIPTDGSVVSIGDYAFQNCTGLTNIIIPESVTSIGRDAFQNCTGLTSITIPESVTSIGRRAFGTCIGLASIRWNAINCRYISGTLYEEEAIGPFSKSGINANFIFGNKVQTIPNALCAGMSNLTSITIPESVTSIGERAFSSCKGLTNVTIPNSVTSIGKQTFKDCTGLTDVAISNSVTSIGEQAFSGCSGLTGITIPESVTSIGTQAFYGCTNIIHTTCLATLPPDMTGNDVFGNYNGYLYVPCNSKEAYTIHSAWGCFRHIFCTADNPDESADETTTDSDDVTVVPSDDEAVFTWPAIDNAVTYTLEITKDGVVFCTLRFDGYGRLLGIAFVQGKGSQSAPAATQSAKAYQFTVTGLSASSLYAYSLQATDRSFLTIASYKGTFNTTGTALPSLDVAPSVQIIGRTIICNTDFRIYSLTGQDLTAHNGSLPTGVYIVRTATSAQKVLVE